MATRATVTHVSSNVYCSSTMHYAVSVKLERGTKRAYYEYDFDGALLWQGKRTWRERPCPKYIEAAILEQLRAMHQAGELHVYENDRDGNRRYTDLRYHDPIHFARLIGLLQSAYLDAPTHCPTCSKPVDADTGFCTHCGER